MHSTDHHGHIARGAAAANRADQIGALQTALECTEYAAYSIEPNNQGQRDHQAALFAKADRLRATLAELTAEPANPFAGAPLLPPQPAR